MSTGETSRQEGEPDGMDVHYPVNVREPTRSVIGKITVTEPLARNGCSHRMYTYEGTCVRVIVDDTARKMLVEVQGGWTGKHHPALAKTT